jgi:hypothetical protein
MEGLSQDGVFSLAIIEITLDVLERIGDDPDRRLEFFFRFVALATELVNRSPMESEKSNLPTVDAISE